MVVDVKLIDLRFINRPYPTNADGFKMAEGLSKVFKGITRAREEGAKSNYKHIPQSVYSSRRKMSGERNRQIVFGNRICSWQNIAVKYTVRVF